MNKKINTLTPFKELQENLKQAIIIYWNSLTIEQQNKLLYDMAIALEQRLEKYNGTS